MHPRSVFNTEPDFNQLADRYDSFRPFVNKGKNGRGYIDFKDPKAVKELTVCIMKEYFNIIMDFPLDSLCPTIPNRLNYILWIQDLIQDTLSTTNVLGIDIGVGASCVYPLLGCASNANWNFLGTDIDERSIQYATKNVIRNNLQDRITIQHNSDPNKIFPIDDTTEYTFCMCNPPFYKDQEEIESGLLNKELDPSAVCLGSNNEMITEGGEVGFISRMIKESLSLGKRIGWYTSLIGIKNTIRPLVRLLKDSGVTNYVVTNFIQGNTTRWAIAWSFQEKRPKTAKVLESWSPKFSFETKLPEKKEQVEKYMKEILDDLEIEYEVTMLDDEIKFECSANVNSWSRAARRQRKKQKLDPDHTIDPLKISIELTQETSAFTYAIVTWDRGGDKNMFESFYSHFKKRIEESCGIYHGTSFKQG